MIFVQYQHRHTAEWKYNDGLYNRPIMRFLDILLSIFQKNTNKFFYSEKKHYLCALFGRSYLE